MTGQQAQPILVGARFEHSRQLDPTWRPGPGQKYVDAPHVLMEISRVERRGNTGRAWYRPVGSSGAGFVANLDAFDEGGDIVGRWIDADSRPAPGTPASAYDVACPVCMSGPGDPCFMRRPPWEACAWPHRERRRAAADGRATQPDTALHTSSSNTPVITNRENP